MDTSSVGRLLRSWPGRAVALGTISFGGVLPLLAWWWAMDLTVVTMVPVLGAAMVVAWAAPTWAGAALVRPRGSLARFAARTLLWATPVAVASFGAALATQRAFEAGLDRLTRRLDPLVAALHRCAAERGGPPADPRQVAPDFLREVPAPDGPWGGRMACVSPGVAGLHVWELRVRVDPLGWVELRYRSDGDHDAGRGAHRGPAVLGGGWALHRTSEL